MDIKQALKLFHEVNYAAGYFFATVNGNIEETSESAEGKDYRLYGVLKPKSFIEVQQFLLLYLLLKEDNSKQKNHEPIFFSHFDGVAKYSDAYGILGTWNKEIPKDTKTFLTPIANNLNLKSDNMLTTLKFEVNNYLEDEASKQIESDLGQAHFIYNMYTTDDLISKISSIVSLGWENDHFKYNEAVQVKAHNWFKNYPLAITENYFIIGDESDHSNKTRLLLPEKDFDYANQVNPNLFNQLAKNIFILGKNQLKDKTIPIWGKYDFDQNKFVLDKSKYTPEQTQM